MVVVLHGCVVVLVKDAQFDQFSDAFVRQIGIDGPRAEAEQGRDLVYVSGLAALQDQGDSRALLGLHQVLLDA